MLPDLLNPIDMWHTVPDAVAGSPRCTAHHQLPCFCFCPCNRHVRLTNSFNDSLSRRTPSTLWTLVCTPERFHHRCSSLAPLIDVSSIALMTLRYGSAPRVVSDGQSNSNITRAALLFVCSVTSQWISKLVTRHVTVHPHPHNSGEQTMHLLFQQLSQLYHQGSQ